MSRNRTIARVTSAGVMAGGLAIYAAQAGILPGVEGGFTVLGGDSAASAPGNSDLHDAVLPEPSPDADTVAVETGAATTGYLPDSFARMQTNFLPPRSGFSTAPSIRVQMPSLGRPAFGAPAVRPVSLGFPPQPELPRNGQTAPAHEEPQEFSRLGLPCGFDVTAEAAPSAMIALGVSAPCHPETDVTIDHAGMAFTSRTDSFGLLVIDIPALESPANVTVSLPDGLQDDAMLPMPELSGLDRVALTWSGDLGMELHALEGDAEWFSDGHVRPDEPRLPDALQDGRGFLSVLGDPEAAVPMFAQIYTMPLPGLGGVNDVTIDAPITPDNCTLSAGARILSSRAGRLDVTPLRFTYPGCDAVGDTLVLQNLVQDLRLAGN